MIDKHLPVDTKVWHVGWNGMAEGALLGVRGQKAAIGYSDSIEVTNVEDVYLHRHEAMRVCLQRALAESRRYSEVATKLLADISNEPKQLEG